jgi:hypothetical protein
VVHPFLNPITFGKQIRDPRTLGTDIEDVDEELAAARKSVESSGRRPDVKRYDGFGEEA